MRWLSVIIISCAVLFSCGELEKFNRPEENAVSDNTVSDEDVFESDADIQDNDMSDEAVSAEDSENDDNGSDNDNILINDEYLKSWTKQWGTDSYDEGNSIAIDKAGNIYVAGFTGNTPQGYSDAYLSKLTSSGKIEWEQQWGTEKSEYIYSVAVDDEGSIYVCGNNMGDIDENTDEWYEDIILSKVASDGTIKWTKHWGTAGRELSVKMAVNTRDYIYIAGRTTGSFGNYINAGGEDLFISKVSSAGTVEWSKQWGTVEDDGAQAMTLDNDNNIYVAGVTTGSFDGNTVGSPSIFVSKLDYMGNVIWNRQTESDEIDSVSSIFVDKKGSVFLTGETYSSKPGFENYGLSDLYILKWDADGAKSWLQFGTKNYDCQSSIAIDEKGNIFVSGSTGDGGKYDIFLSKWNFDGTKSWTEIWGDERDDVSSDIIIDGSGNIYISGSTTGSNGFADFFLTKFEPVK